MITAIVILCGIILLMLGVIVFLCMMLHIQNEEISRWYTPVDLPDCMEVRDGEEM